MQFGCVIVPLPLSTSKPSCWLTHIPTTFPGLQPTRHWPAHRPYGVSTGHAPLLASRRGNTQSDLFPGLQGPDHYTCKVCGMLLTNRKNAARHRRKCEGKCHLECGLCGQQFYRRDVYTKHMKSKHGQVADQPHDQAGPVFYWVWWHTDVTTNLSLIERLSGPVDGWLGLWLVCTKQVKNKQDQLLVDQTHDPVGCIIWVDIYFDVRTCPSQWHKHRFDWVNRTVELR